MTRIAPPPLRDVRRRALPAGRRLAGGRRVPIVPRGTRCASPAAAARPEPVPALPGPARAPRERPGPPRHAPQEAAAAGGGQQEGGPEEEGEDHRGEQAQAAASRWAPPLPAASRRRRPRGGSRGRDLSVPGESLLGPSSGRDTAGPELCWALT